MKCILSVKLGEWKLMWIRSMDWGGGAWTKDKEERMEEGKNEQGKWDSHTLSFAANQVPFQNPEFSDINMDLTPRMNGLIVENLQKSRAV